MIRTAVAFVILILAASALLGGAFWFGNETTCDPKSAMPSLRCEAGK